MAATSIVDELEAALQACCTPAIRAPPPQPPASSNGRTHDAESAASHQQHHAAAQPTSQYLAASAQGEFVGAADQTAQHARTVDRAVLDLVGIAKQLETYFIQLQVKYQTLDPLVQLQLENEAMADEIATKTRVLAQHRAKMVAMQQMLGSASRLPQSY
ncbi:hypothetical protein CAOG_05328 [Capsaspora owczarzaki ATCC 30864]|uniref:Uncharacterized protein n=1 Tax=Capsaspora owczarzaki (strain ATCC 30864) TaxID=595528 RepID=A0A0D2UI00_CAPO3|nr:hypothetical protein CAOG_05328 [Capsaspora owczarzaki ATCC 30864]KJE94736.1 hypothetical protein CAOG_005328 [Capsaspora owczarzaki ATCC 30864]|eukprot:XP_004347013.1 hypothetical protein CAOG_05328 [Capsaspora owczarzaki ATCC 30864]